MRIIRGHKGEELNEELLLRLEGIIRAQKREELHPKTLRGINLMYLIGSVKHGIVPHRLGAEDVHPDHILSVVCDQYLVTRKDLTGRSRARELVMPRQIAMYFIKQFTKLSLSDIGRIMNRDHATVLYSIRKVKDFIEIEPETAEAVNQIMRRI